MAIYFVKTQSLIASPSGTNDGRDPFGFDLDGATKSGSSITAAGAFSAYSHEEGDIIAIADGDNWGWYRIAAKVSDDEITLGTLLQGDSISDGSIDSSDGPVDSIPQLIALRSSSLDHLVICADGIHKISDEVSVPGSTTIFGASGRGHLLEDIATIQIADGFTDTSMFSFSGGQVNFHHLDLLCKAADETQVRAVQSNNQCLFRFCKFRHFNHRGIEVDSGGNNVIAFCEFTDWDNGTWGGAIRAGTTHRNNVVMYCLFARQTGSSGNRAAAINFASNDGNATVDGCIFYDIGTAIGSDNQCGYTINGCVFYDCRGTAIDINDDGTHRTLITNSAFVNNGGYAIEVPHFHHARVENCLFYENTSGVTNLHATVNDLFGSHNVSGDPLFKDPNNGDFTPQEGSPLIAAGVDAGEPPD